MFSVPVNNTVNGRGIESEGSYLITMLLVTYSLSLWAGKTSRALDVVACHYVLLVSLFDSKISSVLMWFLFGLCTRLWYLMIARF